MNLRFRQPTSCRPFVACLALLTMALAQGPTIAADAKTADEKEEGFTPMVKDSSHEGWIGYSTKEWPKGWEVKDGVFHRASGGGDIMTEKEYGDFDFRFQWKISEGGNSGVMYRVKPGQEPGYYTGPEYQVLDNARHPDGKNKLTSAGSIYALYAPEKDVAKPPGEWNDGRITIEHNRVTHYLNGEKVTSAEFGSDDWNKRVAGSKFALWTGFAKSPRGRLLLQDHGNEVWFRKLRIKELGKQDAKP